jgi:hypothetical protein
MDRVKVIGKKTGKTYFVPRLSMDELGNLMLDHADTGWCVACGQEVDGVEPDARKYPCQSCNQDAVFGLQELVIMNWIR